MLLADWINFYPEYTTLENYRISMLGLSAFYLLFFATPVVVSLLGLIKALKTKSKVNRTTFIILLIILIVFSGFLISTAGRYLKGFVSSPQTVKGECSLVRQASKHHSHYYIQIQNQNYLTTESNFLQLLQPSDNIFRCYTNQPCVCNSQVELVVLPGPNVVLEMKKMEYDCD